jgi:deoxyribonuclease V
LQVPKGKVTTYRAIASALGDPIAARAVGQIMASNEQPDVYPCYKVVHSDGNVGNYSGQGGIKEKIRRLQTEGIKVKGGHVVGLSKYLFSDFSSSKKPLKRLRELQEELSSKISLVPQGVPKTAGGVDISYRSHFWGAAAYVLLEVSSKRLLGKEVIQKEVSFPYIPTYLAFRELSLLQTLLGKVIEGKKMADVVLVDGNGILHPRHAGVASHLGVLLDIPTIGVTKSLLCGEVDLKGIKPGEVRYVLLNDKRVGAALRLTERAGPIFVSPGHRIDLEGAIEVVIKTSAKHKLPEPIKLAHHLSKEAIARIKQTQMALGLNCL